MSSHSCRPVEVRVVTPSRLHFGLIDLNGKLGRIDGGFGLALERPRFVLRLRPARGVHLEGAGSFQDRVAGLADRLCRLWSCPGVWVRFEETIPPHSGFGSGTQLTLALIHGIATLHGVPLDREEAVRLSQRGGTSGIGVYAFYHGGFLVDGGHRFPEQKASYLPSAASPKAGVGPLLLRRDFPNWPLLLAVPQARHIAGQEERRLFETLCPQPESAAAEICYRLLMTLLPALVEEDLRAFAESLEAIQQIGWKRVELEAQEPIVQETIGFLHACGAFGVAMSSWGPALVALAEDPHSLASRTEAFLRQAGNDGWCLVTHANNVGARIERIE